MDIRGNICYRLHLVFHSVHSWCTTLAMHTSALCKGVALGRGCKATGVPYFYRVPNTQIRLGDGCVLRSSFRSNNIGSMQRCRICTITPQGHITIGRKVGISAATIVSHKGITIGDYTQIGAGTVITDSDWHSLAPNSEARIHGEGRSAEVTVGSNVFIGTRCMILKGVTIGDNAVVGAGSVVTHDIPANAIAAGNPCRVVGHV